MADFNLALEKLLIKEGGAKISNHPQDRGGLTKWGISQLAYPNVDIASLTKQQAAAIYKRDYWDQLDLDNQVHQSLAEIYFLNAVHIGPNSFKQLLSVIPAKLDDQELAILQIRLAMIMRYCHICNKNPRQKVFLLGWLNRILN